MTITNIFKDFQILIFKNRDLIYWPLEGEDRVDILVISFIDNRQSMTPNIYKEEGILLN